MPSAPPLTLSTTLRSRFRSPGTGDRMKLYWSARHNFGDSLNPWLWEKLLPGALDQDSSEILVGIGTLLNHKLPRTGHKHVFGSG